LDDCASALPPLAQVAFGYYHALALSRDGRVYCWGNGMDGECGLGDQRDFPKPTLVPVGGGP
jgi:alpha-tubulin suppressor-like RCC1 family protein